MMVRWPTSDFAESTLSSWSLPISYSLVEYMTCKLNNEEGMVDYEQIMMVGFMVEDSNQRMVENQNLIGLVHG